MHSFLAAKPCLKNSSSYKVAADIKNIISLKLIVKLLKILTFIKNGKNKQKKKLV
jgi:hypothetical protein